jgi:hypothetical protein
MINGMKGSKGSAQISHQASKYLYVENAICIQNVSDNSNKTPQMLLSVACDGSARTATI